MYDLVLKGGVVIDPSQGLNGKSDLAVENGKIAAIAADIPRTEARRTIEAKDWIVTPDLIDLHAHVFEGVARNGVNPDIAGVRAGVTTIVDAGSAGCATFPAFPRHILPKSDTEVIPFLHICQTGLTTSPDIIAESSIDYDGRWRPSRSIEASSAASRRGWSHRRWRSSVWRCRGSPSARPRPAGCR